LSNGLIGYGLGGDSIRLVGLIDAGLHWTVAAYAHFRFS
jgi:hypothetical protein